MAKITEQYFNELSIRKANGEISHDRFFELLNEKSSKPEWISVKERLPKPLENVICVNEYVTSVESWMQHTNKDSEWFKNTFTHWMPLPNKPL